jgi:two-component system sensor histidine kinase MprB
LGLQRHVELALHEAPGVDAVRGNHAALVLAVTNLIENALCYAPAGTAVEVAIAAPARISVLDRGPGVAEAHRMRIFGRFERGPAAAEGGAGLGLAIVAGIAAAHGGAVSVSAREGGGAAFILRLPVAHAAALP